MVERRGEEREDDWREVVERGGEEREDNWRKVVKRGGEEREEECLEGYKVREKRVLEDC